MGPNKTIPITDIIEDKMTGQRYTVQKGKMAKLAPRQASSAQRYKEYN